MSARVMHALGATVARAHDLRHRRDGGHRGHARHLARGRSRRVAPRPPSARLGLEPDVHGAAPVAQAARGAPRRRPPGGGGPVPQPHRAGGRRAPAADPRHRRRAGDRDDARGGGRRPPGRGLVPRPRRRLRRAARGAGRPPRRALRGDLRRGRRRRSPARDATSPPPGRRCCASGSAPSATWARPAAYSTIASLPVLTGAWRERGGGCSYIPMATAAAVSSYPLEGARPAPAPGADDQHVPARATRSPTPRSTRRSRRSCAGTRTRRRSPRIRSACSRGCGARTCSPSCSSSS